MRKIKHLEELTSRYLALEAVKGDVLAAYEILRNCYADGGRVMITGDGGSYTNNEYIVGGLMKGFAKYRPVFGGFVTALEKTDEKREEEPASCLQGDLPAIALTGHVGLSTALFNDVNGEMIYVQQLCSYRKRGDAFMGISTSGNAENVMYAVAVAKASGIKTIGLTDKSGGRMAEVCDCSIVVPSDETFKIQELHLLTYHALRLMLEKHFYEV